MSAEERPRTLAEKVWDRHVVRSAEGEPTCSTSTSTWSTRSPRRRRSMAFAWPATVRRPDLTVATEDHNVPTADIDAPIADPISRKQVETLRANAEEFGIVEFPMGSPQQGIVHIIGPEQGRTLPGMTIVCGDSHTSTHGAFGALAFGIGTSEVEHVLATRPSRRPARRPWRSPSTATCAGGHRQGRDPGHHRRPRHLGRHRPHRRIYRGSAIRSLSMEGRMTVCNMSIEAGAKAGLIADEVTFEYLKDARTPAGRRVGPSGGRLAHAGHRRGRHLRQGGLPRRGGHQAVRILGNQPRSGHPLSASIPSPDDFDDQVLRRSDPGARYMDLSAGTPMRQVPVDTIFIGSCTNGRGIEDLAPRRGGLRPRVADGVRTWSSRLARGQGSGGGRGPRRGVPHRRVRLARSRAAPCAWP